MPPHVSSTMNVTRASNSAAVIDTAANRSPIGKAIIFLTQRTPGSLSMRCHTRRTRRGSDGFGGAGRGVSGLTAAGPSASMRARRAAAAAPRASRGCSSGGCSVSATTFVWPAPNEKSDRWRTVCIVSVAHASSHTGSPARLAPMARPVNAMYSLARSKIESSQAPSLENVRV